MSKTNKVVEFVKDHKKEIVIATVASVVGVAAGLVGCNCYISKSHGDLFKVAKEFSKEATTGNSMLQSLTKFLDESTKGIYPITPNVDKTIADVFNADLIDVLAEHGVEASTRVSGILLGTNID